MSRRIHKAIIQAFKYVLSDSSEIFKYLNVLNNALVVSCSLLSLESRN